MKKATVKISQSGNDTPERDEIPPDSDLKNQYRNENSPSQIKKEIHFEENEAQENQENQEIAIEENIEETQVNQLNDINQQNTNEYQVNQEAQEYEVLKAGGANELSQNQNVYQTTQSKQSYQIIEENSTTPSYKINNKYGQDYQSVRYGEPYEIINKDKGKGEEYRVYQDIQPELKNQYIQMGINNQNTQTPSQVYKYQEVQKNVVIPVTPIINTPIIINEGDSENVNLENENYQVNKIYKSKKIENIENKIRNNNYNIYNMNQFRRGIHEANKKKNS